MITVQEFCDGKLRDMAGLKKSLGLAMQIEFATIPPYLCAQWSIKHDPDRVEAVFHHIVGQEMDHLAMIGNILTAIGKPPKIAQSQFLPKYPLKSLPGGISQEYPVSLDSLSFEQIRVFMQIEAPSFAPVASKSERRPATIGDFYSALSNLLQELNPRFDPDANFVPVRFWKQVTDLYSAIETIERIKQEGEGLQDSPHQPTPEGPILSHYYLFRELYKQQRLVKTTGGWKFAGDRISLPECYASRAAHHKHPKQKRFSSTLNRLLKGLDACWKDGANFNAASMLELQESGKDMFRSKLCPQFII